MSIKLWEYSPFKNLVIGIVIIIIIIILLSYFIKLNKTIKIIYFIIITALILYLIKDKFINDLYKHNSKIIEYNRKKLQDEYKINYKMKDPKYLANIANKNIGYIPMYYINLDRSISRRNDLEKQLNMYNLTAIRISGLDGKKLKYNTNRSKSYLSGEIDGTKFISFYPELTPSEIGCTLSHFKAVEQAYNDGHQIAIILEDDIGFDMVPHWDKTMHDIITTFPSNWTVINLNSSCNINKIISYTQKQCWSTSAYILNRKGMEYILKLKTSNGIWEIKKPMFGLCDEGVADCLIYTAGPGAYSYHQSLFFTTPVDSVIGNPLWGLGTAMNKFNNFDALKNYKSRNKWNTEK